MMLKDQELKKIKMNRRNQNATIYAKPGSEMVSLSKLLKATHHKGNGNQKAAEGTDEGSYMGD